MARKQQQRKGKEAIRREVARQRRARQLVALLLAIIVVVGVVTYLFMRGDKPDPSPNEAAEFAGGPPVMLFADFSERKQSAPLLEYEIGSGEIDEVGTLPQIGSTSASQVSKWISYITAAQEGPLDPKVFLYDPETEEETEIGSGLTTLWSSSSEKVAFAEPIDLEACTAEECAGPRKVHVYDAATGESEVVVEGAAYTPAFWAGEWLIVFDEDDDLRSLAIGPDGERKFIDIRPQDLWGASPDGRWLVRSGPSSSAFVGFSGGELTGDEVEIDVDQPLEEGAWSFDSTYIAAGVPGEGLRLFSPHDGAAREVPGDTQQVTRVLWDPDNDGFMFNRVTNTIDAFYCTVGDDIECSQLEEYTGEGRLPLRLV